MADINKTTYFYRHKFKRKEAQYNQHGRLPDYFGPMIGDKKRVVIAELGAGPVNTIGDEWPGVEVEIRASDVMAGEYSKFWQQHKKTPLVPVVYEDFEHLSYPDNTFDIVHCRNAIDHTPDFPRAIAEMKRVCKPGGWVYLAHAPGQKTRYGGMHHYNFEEVELPEFKTHTEGDLIISIWQKI